MGETNKKQIYYIAIYCYKWNGNKKNDIAKLTIVLV